MHFGYIIEGFFNPKITPNPSFFKEELMLNPSPVSYGVRVRVRGTLTISLQPLILMNQHRETKPVLNAFPLLLLSPDHLNMAHLNIALGQAVIPFEGCKSKYV